MSKVPHVRVKPWSDTRCSSRTGVPRKFTVGSIHVGWNLTVGWNVPPLKSQVENLQIIDERHSNVSLRENPALADF